MLGRWALLLEDFNYKVEHRSGKNMTHVDALSRNSLTTMLVAESEESIIVRQKKAHAEDKDLLEIWGKIEHVANGYILKMIFCIKKWVTKYYWC